MTAVALEDSLPPRHRIALAYAPASLRAAWLVLLALDTRLAATVRATREPMLGQVRLAWWRDRLGEDAVRWPAGEPLLAALGAVWADAHGALIPLVDGWEHMLGDAPLSTHSLDAMAQGRAGAFAALASQFGHAQHADALFGMARHWALADLATHLGHPQEQAAAHQLATDADWQHVSLPRALRPMVVLAGLAARDVARIGKSSAPDRLALLVAMRLGMFGR